ncbi:MAG: glutathione S-transferase family protein [Pseudomonadota bacterium]
MQLTHFKLCPRSRAARLILAELGLEPDLVDTLPWALSRAHLNDDPSGRLPLLRRADGTLLCGFYALLEFVADGQREGRDLDDLLGGTPADDDVPARHVHLMPTDLDDRAEVRRLIEWFNEKCDREVTQELTYEKVRVVLDRSCAAAPNVAMLKAARANLRYHLDYVSFIADQRRWLAGEMFSAADLVAAAHISVIDYLNEIDWPRAPHVLAWYQRVKSRRSFQPLLVDRVPGLAPPSHYAELDF